MEITEVRIKLMSDNAERLLAFCSFTIDHCFVIRDLKIIRGMKGAFVAMPSRKLTDHCSSCHSKNALRACYCSQCGRRLRDDRAVKGSDGRAKLYADIAHPINSECRDQIQHRVLSEYEQEVVRSQQPGYVCRYDDYDAGEYELDEAQRWDAIIERQTRRVDTPSNPPPPHQSDLTPEDHARAKRPGVVS